MQGVYKNIGVALTFSPRLSAVLAEADRVARSFGGPLSVIHASAESEEAASRFREAFERLRAGSDFPIHWSVADTPIEAILGACAKEGMDLLIAGALEREAEHRYFLGGVARELLRRAPCDLLLFPKPEEAQRRWRRIVVEVDLKRPSVSFLNRVCLLATRLGVEEIVFIGVVTPFDEAIARNSEQRFDEAALAAIVDQAEGFEREVECRLLHSTTGFAVCDFVQNSGADLFVAGTARSGGVRSLPSHMDWLLQVIPTNVLLLGIEP